MPIFENISLGFQIAFTLENLLYCFVGVSLGTFVGVLPGIGALAAVSMLLPVTFYMEPTAALVMLAGVYYGSEYGGSIASILLNLPGTTSSAITCLDGYPMTKQGRAGVALFITAISSFIGAVAGIVILMAFAPVVANVALAFAPADYFAVLVLGLVAAATITQGSAIKGLAMVTLGLLIGSIGTDVQTGMMRYNFGFPELYDGISIIALAMGLFGLSEVIASIRSTEANPRKHSVTLRSMVPTVADLKAVRWPMLRGTAIGSFFGALPGTGQTIASFISYSVEKRVARDPSRFGNGAIEGIASPEAANNAACQTAFVPTLTLGIPGSATMALMLGAMMIHGITPGPGMMRDYPDVFWGLIISFGIGNAMLLLLNIPLIGVWVRIVQLPYHYLYPSIIVLICIGVYTINNSVFDIAVVFIFGIIGYIMKLLDFEPAPVLIGFFLGPILEENFRRTMLLARGDFQIFLERPISAVFLIVAIGLVVWAIYMATQRQGASRAT